MLVALAAVVAAIAFWRGPPPVEARFGSTSQATPWGQEYLPNLPVVDQDGRTYRFYDDLIKGKRVIINFVYTGCSDICPLTTARMAVLQDKLGDIVGREVEMYSISVDPEHDGPAELKRYMEAFHIGPGWRFLTGDPADIQVIRDRLGERAKVKSEHRHEMLLGNDVIGDWSKDSAYGDLDRVVMNVRAMDPNWRLADNPVSVVPANVATFAEVSGKPGEALFIKACSSCHTVGHGDKVGPDLQDVAGRRERGWLTRFISRPDRMIASKDAIAVALLERFPAVKMPNLGLSEQDADDVLAYIAALSFSDPGGREGSAQHGDVGHHHH